MKHKNRDNYCEQRSTLVESCAEPLVAGEIYMNIELVTSKDLKSGRGSRSKGVKYGKYARAIEKHIPWLKAEIEKSPEHEIIIKNEDMRKELGREFEKLNPTSVYWALKYVLFLKGIVVGNGTHKTGEKVLIFSAGDENDKLPPSLNKYLETEEEPVEDEPEEEDESAKEDEPVEE